MNDANKDPQHNAKPHSMYYLAFVCPEQVDEKVRQFKLWMQEMFGCKAALKSPAHITLIPPFWYDESVENILLDLISSFHSDLEKLEIQLQGFSHFAKRVLFVNVLPNPGLNEIRRQTLLHFKKSLGDIIKEETRPFTPHITIANRDLKPADFDKAWAHFMNRKFQVVFETQQISLLKLSREKWNIIAVDKWKKLQ